MSFASLLPRVVTASVIVAALVLFFSLGGLWLRLFILLVALVALWEYYSLFWKQGSVLKTLGLGGCVLLFFGSEPVLAIMVFEASDIWAQVVPTLGSCCMIIFSCAFLFSYGTGNDRANMADPALVMSGLMYIALPLLLALMLTLPEQILMLAVVAATDTCAYFAGNFFGKRRIWPRVSPNKSLEGCIGGIVGSVAVCFVYLCWAQPPSFTAGRWYVFILLGIWLALGAMLGDFFESALKRVQGVKDSGSILPGHGGVLDRIDSLLFVVPLYFFAKYLV